MVRGDRSEVEQLINAQAVQPVMDVPSVTDLGAAVAMLAGVGNVQGVVRFLQLSQERCLIDGTIDGLEPGHHGLHVHTLGDLTQDCNRSDLCAKIAYHTRE